MSDTTSSQNAQPLHEVTLPDFYIDIYEITYGDFLKFKSNANYSDDVLTNPIRGVSWYEAEAYCLWLGKRLPTEIEWEKAARGTDGRRFVWGNEFNKENANFGKTVKPGGGWEKDKSAYNIYDLNGNVSEWTSSWYLPYPNAPYQDKNYGKKYKVIRGGAINKTEHGFLEEFNSLYYRNFAPPSLRSWDTGFRCAKSSFPNTTKN